MTHPIQHIGNTILLVMMDVEEGHEAEFDRWWNEEHLQRCLSSRRPDPQGLQRFCNGPDDPARPALVQSGQTASV